MNILKENFFFFKNIPFVKCAFAISFIYWTYLACFSEMIIAHDAISYEHIGKSIFEKGVIEYFRSGPNREPLYPLLIAFSMRLSNILSISYQTIQIFIQVSILFITQYLMLNILNKLDIRAWIKACAILYAGISPALVNSAFSLYSEIAGYPFVLLIVIFTLKLWQNFQSPNSKITTTLFYSTSLCLTFIAMTFVKGLFEYVFYLYICFFIFSLIKCKLQKHQKALTRNTIALTMLIIMFYSSLFVFKTFNKIYNGQFTLTDRGATVLYRCVSPKMEPLTAKKLLAAVATIPSWRFCYAIFDKETCSHWQVTLNDAYYAEEKNKHIPPNSTFEEENKILMSVSFKKILSNPLQFGLLTFIESCKLIFWESPIMQYVYYPERIVQLYKFKPINLGLYIVMPLLTLISLLYGVCKIFIKRNEIFQIENIQKPGIIIFFIFWLIFSFICLQSLFFIVPRYIFNIVPLYLILISFWLNSVIKSNAIKRK